MYYTETEVEDHTEDLVVVTCARCREGVHIGPRGKCNYCGSTDRYPVAKRRRRKTIGGKRGRNSGKVKTSKKG